MTAASKSMIFLSENAAEEHIDASRCAAFAEVRAQAERICVAFWNENSFEEFRITGWGEAGLLRNYGQLAEASATD